MIFLLLGAPAALVACGHSASSTRARKDASSDAQTSDATTDTGGDAGEPGDASNDIGALPDAGNDGGVVPDAGADASSDADASVGAWTTLNPGAGEPLTEALDSGVLFVAGDTVGTDSKWRIMAIDTTDGSTLWSVDQNFYTSDPKLMPESATGIAVDADNVYVVGDEITVKTSTTRYSIRVEARKRSDGSLVWSVPFDFSIDDDVAGGVAVDATGVYVAAGAAVNYPSQSSWRLIKLNTADGSTVWSLNEVADFKGWASSVAAYAGDVFFAGQYISGSGSYDWRVERRSADSTLVWYRELPLGNSVLSLASLAVRASGVYAVGEGANSLDATTGVYNWRVEKLALDGSPGWLQNDDLSPGSEEPQSVFVDNDGVYVAGYTEPSATDTAWRLEQRAEADGSLDWSQDDNPGTGLDRANACVADANWLYVAGSVVDSAGARQWSIQRRHKNTGAL